MHALVVTLMLAAPGADGLLGDAGPGDDTEASRVERDRCLVSGAAGILGTAVGIAVGGGAALILGEIVKATNPDSISASKNFNAVGLPLGALVGGLAGAAVGTIGTYTWTEDLARSDVEKRDVTR